MNTKLQEVLPPLTGISIGFATRISHSRPALALLWIKAKSIQTNGMRICCSQPQLTYKIQTQACRSPRQPGPLDYWQSTPYVEKKFSTLPSISWHQNINFLRRKKLYSCKGTLGKCHQRIEKTICHVSTVKWGRQLNDFCKFWRLVGKQNIANFWKACQYVMNSTMSCRRLACKTYTCTTHDTALFELISELISGQIHKYCT